MTFVTFEKAKEMKLKGRAVQLRIVVVGGQTETIESEIFEIKLKKSDGSLVNIEAYGIERISSTMDTVDIDAIAKIFNVKPAEIANMTNQQSKVPMKLLIKFKSLKTFE